jgi:hypothetical protein
LEFEFGHVLILYVSLVEFCDIEHTLGAAENSPRGANHALFVHRLRLHALSRLSGRYPFAKTERPRLMDRAQRMMRIKPGIRVKQVGGIGARSAQRNKKRLPKTSFSVPQARLARPATPGPSSPVDAAQTPFFVQKHED